MDPAQAALCAAEATETEPVGDCVPYSLSAWGPALAGVQAARERSWLVALGREPDSSYAGHRPA